MSKQPVQTDRAPAAIGTYSQAIRSDASQTVYLSGQIPLDPQSMQVVSEHFDAQAHQVFRNLQAVANAAGGSLADCVKLNVYLTDLNNFEEELNRHRQLLVKWAEETNDRGFPYIRKSRDGK